MAAHTIMKKPIICKVLFRRNGSVSPHFVHSFALDAIAPPQFLQGTSAILIPFFEMLWRPIGVTATVVFSHMILLFSYYGLFLPFRIIGIIGIINQAEVLLLGRSLIFHKIPFQDQVDLSPQRPMFTDCKVRYLLLQSGRHSNGKLRHFFGNYFWHNLL